MEVVQFDGAREFKILTSKKVDCFAFVQEILGLDVKSCIVLSVGAPEGEALPCQRLESGFDTHVRTYLREKLCSDVPDSIVSEGRHGTLWAAESVVKTKRLTTWAVCGQPCWCSTKPKA